MGFVSERQLEDFAAACHRIALYDLVRCSSGNLSCRVDESYMLITASHAWMADLSKEQIAICHITNGVLLNDRQPSAEIGFHLGILRARLDVNVVLHFQSPCATVLACCDTIPENFFVIPEVPYYIGSVATVPYMNPGSKELAESVVKHMEKHNMLVIRNHGQVTAGKDFNEVIQRAVFFELACEVILRAGDKIKTLSSEAVRYLSSQMKRI